MQIITTTYLLYNYTLRLFVRTFNNSTQTIHRRKCKNSAAIWYWLKWLHLLLLDDDAIRELPHASIVASRGWREPQPKRNRERKRRMLRRTKFHCYQLNSSFWFLLSTDITIVLAFTHQHNVCVDFLKFYAEDINGWRRMKFQSKWPYWMIPLPTQKHNTPFE